MSLPVYRFTNRLGEPCHEHPRQKTSVKSNPFLGGAAIGAVIALLTAPDSGANTRHKIAGKIKQGGQKVKDTLEEGYHSMQHSMQE